MGYPKSSALRAILIHAAMVGYGHQPTFQVYAPGQKTMEERIEHEVKQSGALRRAIEADGLSDDWSDVLSVVIDKAKL